MPAMTAVVRAIRRVLYAPHLDGRADPGEIVWTEVSFEDQPDVAKDRPVLVVGWASETAVLALMLSSQARRAHDPMWMPVGRGRWDLLRRRSWVRLDRVLELPDDAIRREGAVLDRARFDAVATRLRQHHGWE